MLTSFISFKLLCICCHAVYFQICFESHMFLLQFYTVRIYLYLPTFLLFLLFQSFFVSVWKLFSFSTKNPLFIYFCFCAGILLKNSLRFLFKLSLLSHLKDQSLGGNIQTGSLFFFSISNMSLHCLPVYIVSIKNSTISNCFFVDNNILFPRQLYF